jgi:hypothetical protein
MNTTKFGLRLISALLILSMAAFVGCSEEDELDYADKQSVSSEASTDSYFEDAEDLSFTVSAASNTDIGGRVAGVNDDRLACATLSLSEGATTSLGTITIDFGTGCTVNGVTRKGIIHIAYEGERLSVGSSITITFDGYYVNGIKIQGTRTVEISEITSTSITHEITLTDGLITWPDNSTANRIAHHFRKWSWNTLAVRTDDEVRLLTGGTASGENRNGTEYAMQITADIVFDASCWATKRFLPVSGEKVLVVGGLSGKEIIVNYGSGDCDNTITVTINGKSASVTVDRG